MDEGTFVEKFTDAALRYDCDKVIDHDYASFYSQVFCGISEAHPRLLEIGVGGYDDPELGGASARVWQELLPTWTIFLVDVHDKNLIWPPGVTFIKADQSNEDHLRHIGNKYGPFDVIIDDGSHHNSHVRTSLLSLFPYLAVDGWYVVEDTQTSYLEAYGGTTSLHAPTTANLARELFDCVNQVELPDDSGIPRPLSNSVSEVRFRHNIMGLRKDDHRKRSNLEPMDIENMLRVAQSGLSPDQHGVGYWSRVARYLNKIGRREEAAAFLEAGLSEHPQSTQLRRIYARLNSEH